MSLYPAGTDFRSTSDYKGYVHRTLNATLIPISTLIFGTRIYVRLFMTKNAGLDDIMAFIAYLFLIGLSTFDIIGVKYGSGAHMALIPQQTLLKFFSTLVTQNLWYFWAVCFVRLAVAAFLPRLSKEKLFMNLVYGIAAFSIVQTTICFLYKLLECKPVSDLWKPPHFPGTKCVSDQANEAMMTVNAVFGIFTDIVLLALPIWIISRKMIMSTKMMQVVAIFCVGIFVVVTGVVRLFYMKTLSFASDPTFHMSTIGVWTDLEAHIGLWCGCFPALQPILRIISFRLGLRTKLTSSYGHTPGKKSVGTSGHLGGSQGVMRSNHGYVRSGVGRDRGTETDGDGDGDGDSQKAIVGNGGKSFEMERMNGEIRKETDVVVSVEERKQGKNSDRQESWVDL